MVEAKRIEEAQKAANGVTEEPEEENAMELKHKELIGFDEFEKIELRTGKVISCEAVPKSSKLLCFKIKSGNEERQILSGIHKYYEPEELVGKTVVYVANMKPAKLAGMLSEGMILSAEDDEDNISVVTTQREVKSGAEVV